MANDLHTKFLVMLRNQITGEGLLPEERLPGKEKAKIIMLYMALAYADTPGMIPLIWLALSGRTFFDKKFELSKESVEKIAEGVQFIDNESDQLLRSLESLVGGDNANIGSIGDTNGSN
jgi:hypothetical protein